MRCGCYRSLAVSLLLHAVWGNSRMAEARIPLLSDSQRRATGRDDRPGYANQLVFAFRLNRASEASDGPLVLTGPAGFVFATSCVVVTSQTDVFRQRWPPEFDVWPSAVVVSCVGSGNNATVTMNSGLEGNRLYAFRVGVTNPESDPVENSWTLSYSDEVSDPFVSFKLWTFRSAALGTTSAARTPRTPGYVPVPTLVSFEFEPSNTVAAVSGSIAIVAPGGFTLVGTDGNCVGVSLVQKPYFNELGAPQQQEVWTAFDFSCRAIDDQTLLVLLSGAARSSLMPGRMYALTAAFLNPPTVSSVADTWKLQTFSAYSNDAADALDEAQVTGYAINEVVSDFVVDNRGQINGDSVVSAMRVTVKLPSALTAGLKIQVMAPSEFALEHSSTAGQCRNFRFLPLPGVGIVYPLPTSTVACYGGKLTISVSDALGSETSLSFELDTTNPGVTPGLVDNFWHVALITSPNEIVASHVAAGWTITPQLRDTAILLLPPLLAAGSANSNLEVSFTCESVADAFELIAASPARFSFSRARVTLVTGSNPEVATPLALAVASGATLRVRVPLVAKMRYRLRISGVTLGIVGGATSFHLATFLSDIKQDERRSFAGFRLPGRLTVTDKQLRSPFMWGPRTNEVATAIFTVACSQDVRAGHHLYLHGGTYRLSPSGFRVDAGDSAVSLGSVVNLSPNELTAQLVGNVDANIAFTIQVSAMAPSTQVQGLSSWRLEVRESAANALPINTDDGLTPGFSLVYQLSLEVIASRSPPLANITAEVRVDPGLARPQDILLVAPLGFTFPESCLVAAGNVRVSSCLARQPIDGRQTALVTFREALSKQTQGLIIALTTPAQNPADQQWLVEGTLASSERSGWGSSSRDFAVIQMLETTVSYGRLLNIASQVVVSFRSAVLVKPGGKLIVYHPTGFIANCAGFQKISLPLYKNQEASACSWSGAAVTSPYLTVSLYNDLVPDRYSFAVDFVMPRETPPNTAFSVVLLDSKDLVVDAAIDIQGDSFVDATEESAILVQSAVRPDNLRWYPQRVTAGSKIGVELRFQFIQQAVLDSNGEVPLRIILISFPSKFVSAVESANDVENLKGLPVDEAASSTGGAWVDFTRLDSLKIYIDNKVKIPKGEYWLRFPVFVPLQITTHNVWYVSFCVTTGGCDSQNDSGVIVSLPMAGFDIGEAHPNTGVIQSSGAIEMGLGIWSLVALTAFLIMQ